jgi:hypothetical protein
MIKNTLQKIEDAVRSAPQASAKTKEHLLGLVRELSAELEALESTHREHAHRIAGHAEKAVTEATGAAGAAPDAEPARTGLAASAADFEASHPKLASLVRSISDSLANVGI